MSPEKPLTLPDVFRILDEDFSKNLLPYRRMDPEDRTREMQKVAFGDDAMEVTEAQYQELIGIVREIRPWLRKNGKRIVYHPGLDGTEHEIFQLEDKSDDCRFLINFEPRPWEQSAKYEEPYPKFSVVYEDAERSIEFRMNFDNTYGLTFKNKQTEGAVSFEASGLKRKHMKANEYQVVKYALQAVTSHFGIPVTIAEAEQETELSRQERIESAASLVQTFKDALAGIPEIQDQGNEGGTSIRRGESTFSLNFHLCGRTQGLSIYRYPPVEDPIREEGFHIVLFFHTYRGNIVEAKIEQQTRWRNGIVTDNNSNNQTAVQKIENLIAQLK